MKTIKTMIAAAGCVGLIAVAQGAPQSPLQVDAEAVQQGMAAMMKALGGGGDANTNKAAVVDFRELKALLPAELKGFKRTNAKGGRDSAMGMTVARAEADYGGANDASIHIEITDFAGIGQLATMAQVMNASMEIDEESDNGYRKSITHRGLKGMEEYDSGNKSGEITLFSNRFSVIVRGDNVKPEAIQAALAALDIPKLLALKPAAAAVPAGSAK